MAKTRKAAAHKRRTIRLMVIPEPESGKRSVLELEGEGTLIFNGVDGPPIEMVCGRCGAPLVRGITLEKLHSIVFRCNSCGAFNETLIS
ncbi:MAG: hypothetical protein QOF11_797 [Chloroflexota bacterium]|nr:hypothetical protein [Chloroflexota bacterium]